MPVLGALSVRLEVPRLFELDPYELARHGSVREPA